MPDARLIGVLGGTFDPVHLGHLAMARMALTLPGFSQVRMVPCWQPVHRAMPAASAAHRLRMLEMATAAETGIVVDDLELRRGGPSYMVDTMADLASRFPASRLVLILGQDAFHGLHTWRSWKSLIAHVSLLILRRKSQPASPPSPLSKLLENRTVNAADLCTAPAADVVAFVAEFDSPISASNVRNAIGHGDAADGLLAASVADYIQAQGLYRLA